MSKEKAIKTLTKMAEEKSEGWITYQCPHCGNTVQGGLDFKEVCWHETNHKPPKKYFYPYDFLECDYSEAPEELKKIVEREDYLQVLMKELDKKIIGEPELKETLLVCLFGGRLVKNAKPTSFHILLTEQSGAGKDYVALNTLKLLAPYFWDYKSRLSEKALNYWHPSKNEPYFSWSGKILYVEDVTNSFLNCDTVKVMMTGGSDIAVVKDQVLQTLKVNGSPTFLLTSATAEPNKELSRRITSQSLDSSELQTEKILDFQSKIAKENLPEYDQNVINSTSLTSPTSCSFPGSWNLEKNFSHALNSRTNFDRLLDLIKAHACLHQYSREKKGKNTIIANERDLEVGLRVFKRLYPSRNANLTHSQRKIVDYLKEMRSEKTAPELFREVGCYHYNQLNKLIKSLRSLASKGFVNISEGEVRGKVCDVYSYIPDLEEEGGSKGSKVIEGIKGSKGSKQTPLLSEINPFKEALE